MPIPDYLKPPETTSKKIWGILEKRDKTWIVKGHPYMIAMMKRLFPGSTAHGHGECHFSATKRIVGDLNWLMMRFPLEIKDRNSWMKELLGAQEHFETQEEILKKPMKASPPLSFKGQLKEFQKEGLAFLLHNPRSLLADDVGLGKTIMALAWLSSIKSPPPHLIVVEPHLLIQWKSEIERFLGADIKVHIIRGLKPYSLPACDIYLIHYLLLRGWKNYLPEFGFTTCIFDEIQALRRIESEKYSAASLISDMVDNSVGLSATPISNLGGEIHPIMNILNRNCLGDFGSFSREWCMGYGNKLIRDPELLGVYLKSEGLLLRRKKEDVLDELPPKRRSIQNIDVDTRKFDELIAPYIDQAKRIETIKEAFERGRETMQVVDSTRMITGISKAHYVCAFVKTLMEAGEKVLLFGHHHKVMDIYMEELKGYYPVMISGRQNIKIKNEAQEAFMNEDTDIIILSLRSGTGLNLQRARCVVFGELDWCPSVHLQNEGRAHRIGQKDSVLCYYLVCNAGTDQHMMETLGLKTSQFLGIMGDKGETEEDKMLAQVDMQKHMHDVVELLKQGGRRKEIDESVKPKLKKLERLPPRREPTSMGEFFESVPELKKGMNGMSLDSFDE